MGGQKVSVSVVAQSHRIEGSTLDLRMLLDPLGWSRSKV
jgi:hypothetical protein